MSLYWFGWRLASSFQQNTIRLSLALLRLANTQNQKNLSIHLLVHVATAKS